MSGLFTDLLKLLKHLKREDICLALALLVYLTPFYFAWHGKQLEDYGISFYYHLVAFSLALLCWCLIKIYSYKKSSHDLEKSLTMSISSDGSLISAAKILGLQTPMKSSYDPTLASEDDRLMIQAQRSEAIDCKAFEIALKYLKEKNGRIRALDVGCGNGNVTFNRFGRYIDAFQSIHGIDKNPSLINSANAAKEKNKHGDKYFFQTLDVDIPEFGPSLCNEKPSSYDLIFTALTLHHFADPEAALEDLFKLLSKDGVLIARGSDDGTKICYPESSYLLMKGIIDATMSVEGISDRHNGRKLYSQFKRVGFDLVHMVNHISDTVGLSKQGREDFFKQSFSYRKDYISRKLEKAEPEEKGKLRKQLEQMEGALTKLKNDFKNSKDFYYCEVTFVAIGIKK